jgi:hypothetical protein
MKDVYEVLRQKELEVSRLQKEVDALRVVAPLLKDVESEDYDKPTSANSAAQQLIEQRPARTDHARGLLGWTVARQKIMPCSRAMINTAFAVVNVVRDPPCSER